MKKITFFLLFLVLTSCNSHENATETNVTKTPCDKTSDCVQNFACVTTSKIADSFCAALPEVSSVAPAAISLSLFCENDEECGNGGSCLQYVELQENGAKGFCKYDNNICPKSCLDAADNFLGTCINSNDCGKDIFCVQPRCSNK